MLGAGTRFKPYDEAMHRFAVEGTLPTFGEVVESPSFVDGLDGRPSRNGLLTVDNYWTVSEDTS